MTTPKPPNLEASQLLIGSPATVIGPAIPSSPAPSQVPEFFFEAAVIPILGGLIRVGNTQEGAWIAVQVEQTTGSTRFVLDGDQIDALILALAHQS